MTPEKEIPASSIFIPDKVVVEPLRILEALVEVARKKKYSQVPAHALPRIKFSDKTSNDLTTAILEAFKVHEMFATRIDTKGTYNAKLGRFIPSRMRKGMPDISAILGGRSVYVEVKCKATRDRIRPDQEACITDLRCAGAEVFIAEDFAGFWYWLKDQIQRHVNIPGGGELDRRGLEAAISKLSPQGVDSPSSNPRKTSRNPQ